MRPNASNRFNPMPRARPSIAFDRTLSQSNMTDKYFLSRRASQPQSHTPFQTESLFCDVCNQRKPRCMCVQMREQAHLQSQAQLQAQSRERLQRTQSFVQHTPHSRSQSQYPQSYMDMDFKREMQAIKEAEKLARQSSASVHRPEPKPQAKPQAQAPKPQPTSQPRKRSERDPSRRSVIKLEKSRPSTRKSSNSRTRHRSRSRRTRSRSRRHTRSRSRRESRSRSRKMRSTSKHTPKSPPLEIDYGSSSDEESEGDQIKQVSVTKTAKVEKFLQRNAMLNGQTEDNELDLENVQLSAKQENEPVTREMRYSVSLDQLNEMLTDNFRHDTSNEDTVKVIKRKDKDKFLFQFSRDTDKPNIDYTNKSKRVVSIDKVWKEVMVYYLAKFKGDEKMRERQLRHLLKDYDYLPPAKFVKRGVYIKYIPKSFYNANLQPGGFVDKCTKHSVYIKGDRRDKKKKISRTENFIFVYRYDDMTEASVSTTTTDKSNFRIILEGLMNGEFR